MTRPSNQALLAYIQSVFQENFNRIVCNKHLAEYRKSGLTNLEIENAVKYWFEIKGNTTDRNVTNGSIGIIPYIINESNAYWKEQERLEAIAKENLRHKNSAQETESIEVKIAPIKKPIGVYYFDID